MNILKVTNPKSGMNFLKVYNPKPGMNLPTLSP